MTAWAMLAVAITCELVGTLSLRMAALGSKLWFIVVVIGYLAAFGMLVLTLAAGMPLGVAYGVWAATGVALTALLSRVLFGEPLTLVMGFGIVLIAVGVLLIELGANSV